MTKIMLADDNQISLEYFKNLVDFRRLGFDLVSTAVDGEEAYNDFLRFNPEVIISDIQMPCMDGIELASKVMEKNPGTIVVFLSSYEEFEYARSALNLKVNDYILKHETTKEKLTEKLISIQEIIARQKEKIHNNNERNLYELLQDFNYCSQSKEINKYLKAFPGRYHMVIVEQAHILSFITEEIEFIEKEQSEFRVRDVGYAISDSVHAILKIAPFKFLILLKSNDNEVFNCVYNIKNSLEENLESDFSVIVLAEDKSIDKCLNRYRKNVEIIDNMKFYNQSLIVYQQDLDGRRGNSRIDLSKMVECIKKKQYGQLIELTNRKYNQILYDKDYLVFEELSRVLFKFLLSYHNKYLSTSQDVIFSAYDDHSHDYWLDATEFIHWIKKKLGLLVGLLDQGDIHDYSAEVENALQFINKNYSNSNVSAEMIAEHTKLNINSLNRIFKKETGDTVWKRLTKIRVKKAKQLLEKRDIKVSDVYKQVGFNSLSYFSTAFKKNYGCSPQEYKKKNEIF